MQFRVHLYEEGLVDDGRIGFKLIESGTVSFCISPFSMYDIAALGDEKTSCLELEQEYINGNNKYIT